MRYLIGLSAVLVIGVLLVECKSDTDRPKDTFLEARGIEDELMVLNSLSERFAAGHQGVLEAFVTSDKHCWIFGEEAKASVGDSRLRAAYERIRTGARVYRSVGTSDRIKWDELAPRSLTVILVSDSSSTTALAITKDYELVRRSSVPQNSDRR